MFTLSIDRESTGSLFTYVSSPGNGVVDHMFVNESMRKDIQHVIINEDHPCNSPYHLPFIVHIICDRMCNRERSSILEKECERVVWNKCTSEQIQDYEKGLYFAISDVDDILLNT